MDLQEFAKRKADQAAAFERYWTQRHRKDKSWLLENDLAQWEREFSAFVAFRNEDQIEK